jgi:anaerobic ribonucleoside-triphosphate reductase activating protein
MPRTLRVGGIAPFTATDYPGQLAAVVFVQGCPWRCGYCHNPHLQQRHAGTLDWESVLALLRRRVGLVDAVVFSGGEPTIDPCLGQAIEEVRALGFKVGLHTAGIYPERLREVLPMLDWVGFDIKAPVERYASVTGMDGSGAAAFACAGLVIDSGIAHECRTTWHSALLTDAQLLELATTLSGMGVRNYALQLFRPTGCADPGLSLARVSGPAAATLDAIGALFPTFTLRRSA